MFSQHFGSYLLNRQYITRVQLKDALQFQKDVHVKFGVIAVDQGLMTSQQVEKVHDMQKQMDKRFGEIAIDLGYLTNEQVEQLLKAQKQDYLLLAQALVDRNYMTIEQFSEVLNEYKKVHSLSDEKFEAIKNGDIQVLVENLLDEKDHSKKELFGQYLSLFAKNMIRFIDDQTYLEIVDEKDVNVEEWVVYQEVVGELPLFTAICAEKDLFLYIASIYAEEKLNEVDELAKASVSEFLNLHNGIYLVNKSNDGIELKMKPQQIKEKAIIKGQTFTVNVNTAKGTFQLVLSDQPASIAFEPKENSQLA